MTKRFWISNSTTKYEPSEDEWYIHWDNGNVGAYQFVSGHQAYYAIQDDFKEFLEELKTYDPLDWDEWNDHIVYDLENGKKLIADYPGIQEKWRGRMRESIRKMKLEKAKAEYERLPKGWMMRKK